MYEIEEYFTEAGQSPFDEWLEGLRDIQAKKKILARLARVRLGNLGDWKRLENAQGVCEMREHSGAGYRIYFCYTGKTIILLLAGSDKGEHNHETKQTIQRDTP